MISRKDIKSGDTVRLNSKNEPLLEKYNYPIELVKVVKVNPPTAQLKSKRNNPKLRPFTFYLKDVISVFSEDDVPQEIGGRKVVLV
tara:strand:+ start:2818 stop:3075 length:258 start_codon:yes stop_codon:yes gene_type:complete